MGWMPLQMPTSRKTLGFTFSASIMPSPWEGTSLRSPRGSAIDLRRPSLWLHYTTSAAVAHAVSARTSDIQTLHHGVSLSAWYRPWILLGGLSGSCPRFILASDCIRPPVPTSWFLPHAGLHLATEHSRSQELERGTRYRPVSPLHHLCPHSGDSWRHFLSSNNGVNNTNYCVVVLKCFSTQHHVNLGELNWTDLSVLMVIFQVDLG